MRVYLVWQNDALLAIFAKAEDAVDAMHEIKNQYSDYEWSSVVRVPNLNKHVGINWFGGRIARLEVEERIVV